MPLSVHIGQYTYQQSSITNFWNKSLREIPKRYTPIMKGQINLSKIPNTAGVIWDFISILDNGFGIACNHSIDIDNELSSLYKTDNYGESWKKVTIDPNSSLHSKLSNKEHSNFPILRFDSAILRHPATVALLWNNPYDYDDFSTRNTTTVITSTDRCLTWNYTPFENLHLCIPSQQGSPNILLSGNRVLYSLDPENHLWSKYKIRVQKHADFKEPYQFIRHLCFTEEDQIFGLIVDWKNFKSVEGPKVALLRSIGNLKKWEVLHLFNSNIGDINERHMLGLTYEY